MSTGQLSDPKATLTSRNICIIKETKKHRLSHKQELFRFIFQTQRVGLKGQDTQQTKEETLQRQQQRPFRNSSIKETIYSLALPSRIRCIKKSTRNEFYYQKVLFLTSFFGN
jgi:hypothetical protein